jgi:putative effector of murein hydrolase
VLLGKALPLCLATVALFSATLPRSIAIMHLPIAKTLHTYDAVATIFVAVTGVLLFLGAHTLVAAMKLGRHVWKLNPQRGEYPLDS